MVPLQISKLVLKKGRLSPIGEDEIFSFVSVCQLVIVSWLGSLGPLVSQHWACSGSMHAFSLCEVTCTQCFMGYCCHGLHDPWLLHSVSSSAEFLQP